MKSNLKRLAKFDKEMSSEGISNSTDGFSHGFECEKFKRFELIIQCVVHLYFKLYFGIKCDSKYNFVNPT